jgi:hypothetical protein
MLMRRGLVCLVLGLLFSSFGFSVYAQSDSADLAVETHLDSLFAAFTEGGSDSWWLVSTNGIGKEDFPAVLADAAAQRAAILAALEDFHPSGSLADSIYAFLTPPVVSLYTNGASLIITGTLDADLHGREYCLVGADAVSELPGVVYNGNDDGAWSALMIPGIDWPPLLLAAGLYYEGGYGYLQGSGAFDEDPESAELALAGLEAEVLNLGSGGKTYAKADEIIHRADGSYPNVLLAISLDDLEDFACIIGAEGSGPVVSAAVFDGLLVTVGYRSIGNLLGEIQR